MQYVLVYVMVYLKNSFCNSHSVFKRRMLMLIIYQDQKFLQLGRMTRGSIGSGILQEENIAGNENRLKVNVKSPLRISSSQKGLLRDESLQKGTYRNLTFITNMFKPKRFLPHANSPSPSSKFWHVAEEKDELPHSVPSPVRENLKNYFSGFFSKKIDWSSLRRLCEKWIKNPLNMALLLWIICVAVSGAILFLVMTGMLNRILTKKSQRDSWFEANNQILNALFTLMCLYQHPKRFHHLVLLLRWKPEDIPILRKVYCKNGTCKPHEWFHMAVVVVLLHANCFAQYALCGLNLGFDRSKRPVLGVGLCVSIAISAPALSGLYCIVSPLGKEYELDEEAQNNNFRSIGSRFSLETRLLFSSKNDHTNSIVVEYLPQWRGGLFDLGENLSLAFLTLFCGFCVFGRNMERLHFGNMYVHIATFFLLCVAPFWIFNLAAFHIDDETVRRIMGLVGILLCVFGLLYGGYWRIQMRKRFKLPPNNKLCCVKPEVADFIQWLFCCWCSLAQEVRTAEFYDIVDDKFLCKNNGCVQKALKSLPREQRASKVGSIMSKEYYSGHDWKFHEVEFDREKQENVMEAPIPLRIDVERDASKRT